MGLKIEPVYSISYMDLKNIKRRYVVRYKSLEVNYSLNLVLS